MDDAFDASRYVVRARRLADLSQRELAERLGLSRAAVGRLESARGRIAVDTLVRVLAIAGLRLAVLDSAGRQVDPVPRDVLRDNAHRRFPAHLDVAPPDEVPPLRALMPRYDRAPAKGWYRLRPERDRLRVEAAATTDHPTLRDLDERAQRSARERRRIVRLLRAAAPPVPSCTCPTRCWVGGGCVVTCSCQCEPGPRRTRA